MNLDAAINVIADFLHKTVRDTGRCGLEGLAALLLQQATGQEFRLSSAGRQSGRDAATEAGHGNNIKIEIKHYLQTTSLNQRELIAEINEAAESDPGLDIWVLAASRAVSEQIASSLEKQAERLGVDIVILDYGVDGLPRVAVLMAAYSDVTIAWANKCEFQYDISQIRGALRAIASAPDFEGSKKRVLAKLRSIVGYESARRRTHARLLETLADERDAKSSFRQSLAIRAAEAQVIRRAAPIAELDRWWNSPGVPMPALVLGEEGTGKTWATFDWLLGRLGKDDMPLVLPFAVVAENLSGPDPLERLLPRLLTKWTGVPNEEHWARRLDKWLRSEPIGRPLILLVADGLNECPDVHWRSFFASLQAAPWRDKVAILATDRPHHWKKCSMAGVAAIREIPLGGYSDTELDQALASSSISRRDIPRDLLQLISIPRYCRLVIQHYSEMVASSDFTRERLIYLEIRDRYRLKLDYPLTDYRLFEILRNLAEYARANPILKPKDLLSLISVGGCDDRAVYEEIVSGGIVVEISEGLTKILKVDPLRLVFGFGMLLTEELVQRFSSDHKEGEVEELLTSWFEPQPDMDRKVDICGSALFHSLFQQNFPEVAFRGLLRYWLGLRNWADTAQVAFTDYLLRRPYSFIAVADEFWSSERDNAAAQQFLANAFVAHRDNPAVQPFLVPAVERWMGFVHPLGRRFWSFDVERNQRLRATVAAHTGLPVLTPEDDVAQEQGVKQAIEARAGRPLTPGELEVAGSKLTVVADGPLLRLARFGLMIASAGDRTPYINSLVNWAVASSIMDDSGFSEVVSWVIRLSDQDIEHPLMQRALMLLNRCEQVASDAARILLLTIGSQEAYSLLVDRDLLPTSYQERKREHLADPCKSFFPWSEEECRACMERSDLPLHMVLQRCEVPIVDPLVKVPPSLIQRATQTLATIHPSTIRAHLFHTSESHTLETLLPILCAQAPTELADFMRRVVQTLPERDLQTRYPLAIELPRMSLLLTAGEISIISTMMAELSADASEWSDEQSGPRHQQKIAEARAFSSIAPRLSPWKLFSQLVDRPPQAFDLDSLELWFAPLNKEEVQHAIDLLHTPVHRARLIRVLWVLPHIGVTLVEKDRLRLLELAASEDAMARTGVIRFAVLAEDESLGFRLVGRAVVAGAETELWEARWVTRLLARFAPDVRFEDVAQRLPAPSLSFALRERGHRAPELEVYARCLDEEIKRISTGEPQISVLPEIGIDHAVDDSGANLPRLHERSPEPIWLARSESWTTGRPSNSIAEFNLALTTDTELATRELNEDLRRKVDAILAAWKTDAFKWYGRAFCVETLEALCQEYPAIVESWVIPALEDSGLPSRVRLASLLEPICRALFRWDSPFALKLWETLRSRQDSPFVVDAVGIAFDAPDSSSSDAARKSLLDECWTDDAIARLAFASDRFGQSVWLRKAITYLICEAQALKRMKGLTLACFSDINSDYFEQLVAEAHVSGPWVEDGLRRLRENVRRNQLARFWFSRFLVVETDDEAWCALQIVVLLTDERILNWRHKARIEAENNNGVARRLRFLDLWAKGREFEREFSRERKRKDHLFGLKTSQGEIVPFM